MTKVLTQAGKKRAEAALRRHIRRILTSAGLRPPQPRLRRVEDEVLALFRDYGNAPRAERDEIYAEGKKRMMEALESS